MLLMDAVHAISGCWWRSPVKPSTKPELPPSTGTKLRGMCGCKRILARHWRCCWWDAVLFSSLFLKKWKGDAVLFSSLYCSISSTWLLRCNIHAVLILLVSLCTAFATFLPTSNDRVLCGKRICPDVSPTCVAGNVLSLSQLAGIQPTVVNNTHGLVTSRSLEKRPVLLSVWPSHAYPSWRNLTEFNKFWSTMTEILAIKMTL